MNIECYLIDAESIIDSKLISVCLIVPEGKLTDNKKQIEVSSAESTELLKAISERVTSEYFLFQVKPGRISITEADLSKWIEDAIAKDSSLNYSNYKEIKAGQLNSHPVISYSEGSIRDDFNFGPLALIKSSVLKQYFDTKPHEYQFAGWYDFRLFISRTGKISLSENYNYSCHEPDSRSSGTKQFDYVSPMNRNRQIEMEQAETHHLKEIGALVSPPFREVDLGESHFDIEASVIIPVLNREKTINDAIESVISQKTNFPFNLIIVDNFSTDNTPNIIKSFEYKKIIHHIPDKLGLGIGGCWNEGINHPNCGRFAIQLDSDDVYLDQSTLQKIVDKFYKERCAMVIGSYQMVNFNLEEIPPGVIDHKEWSNDNGPNNALRINGLGAPRAFYTPIIRQIGFPNVSYGEDYAVGLAISRTWKVGRIYEPIYLCRRWDNNTDSNLSIEKVNDHNAYKDSLRSAEIEKRKKEKVISH